MNGASPVVAPGKALQRMRGRGSRRCLGLSCRPDDSTINGSRPSSNVRYCIVCQAGACLSQCEFDSIQTGLGSVRDPTGIVQQRVDNRQNAERTCIEQLIVHEIHTQPLVWVCRLRNHAAMETPVLTSSHPHPELQALETIQPVHGAVQPRGHVPRGPRRATGCRRGHRVVPPCRRAGPRPRAVQPRGHVCRGPRRATGCRRGPHVVDHRRLSVNRRGA